MSHLPDSIGSLRLARRNCEGLHHEAVLGRLLGGHVCASGPPCVNSARSAVTHRLSRATLCTTWSRQGACRTRLALPAHKTARSAPAFLSAVKMLPPTLTGVHYAEVKHPSLQSMASCAARCAGCAGDMSCEMCPVLQPWQAEFAGRLTERCALTAEDG